MTAANNAAGDDIVDFNFAGFGPTPTITLTLGEIIFGANGTLTINGTGADLLTIDGNLTSRIFKTVAGVVATVNDLKLTRGNGVGSVANNTGGAIYNDLGTLTLNHVIVTESTATNGGGIRNSGRGSVLNINNSIISNNTATTSSGGGMQNFSSSTVNINSSTFIGNTSGGTTGGGGAQFNGIGSYYEFDICQQHRAERQRRRISVKRHESDNYQFDVFRQQFGKQRRRHSSRND